MNQDPDDWLTHSLRELPIGAALTQIIALALDAVDPVAAVHRVLRRDDRTLYIGDDRWTVPSRGRLIVVGAGKAGAPMAQAVVAVGGTLVDSGIVVVKDGHASSAHIGPIALPPARHPLPDQRGVDAAGAILTLLEAATPNDRVLVLLSGGGSALLTAPVAGISLTDLQTTTDRLLQHGAPIAALNAVRKHCERLKGGQLAQRTRAPIASLIISDVVGSPLDVIASGPTTPNPTTFADAWRVLDTFGGLADIPQSVRDHLQTGMAGQIAETPKPDDPVWARVNTILIARNEDAIRAAADAATVRGFEVRILPTPFESEARQVGRTLAQHLISLAAHVSVPTVLIGGGETTVTIRGGERARGAGGRNQELALAAALELAGHQRIALAAVATDGGDGPTDAAGAIATGATIQRAQQRGLEAEHALATNRSYPFWRALDDAFRPGPTLTNVNDLVIGIIW